MKCEGNAMEWNSWLKTTYLKFKQQNQGEILLPFSCLNHHVSILLFSSRGCLPPPIDGPLPDQSQRQTSFKKKIADISGIKQVKKLKTCISYEVAKFTKLYFKDA